jgi:hypothetical protein
MDEAKLVMSKVLTSSVGTMRFQLSPDIENGSGGLTV